MEQEIFARGIRRNQSRCDSATFSRMGSGPAASGRSSEVNGPRSSEDWPSLHIMKLQRHIGGVQAIGGVRAIGGLRSIRNFAATSVAFVVLILGMASLVIWNARERAFNPYQDGITSLSVVLSEQTERYVQVVDLAMLAVQSAVAEHNDRTDTESRAYLESDQMHQLLAERVTNVPQVNAIAIVGASGDILNSSRPRPTPIGNLSNRDFLQYLKSHDDPAIFVGAPNVGRISGKWSLFFARRINHADGSFLGLVVGVVDAAYLQNFYRSVSTDGGGSITVLNRDGTVLVRYPDLGNNVGHRVPARLPGMAWLPRTVVTIRHMITSTAPRASSPCIRCTITLSS